MNQQSREPNFLAVDDMRPLIAKLLMPALLTAAGVFLAVPPIRPAGVILCAAIAFMGVVQFLVVGLVKPTEECLFYKRFFEWRRVEYADIVRCSRSIFPLFWGLHYLKHRDSRIFYFVQYHPVRPLVQSQYELDRSMIEQIRARVAGKSVPAPVSVSGDAETSTLPPSPAQLGIKACAITAALSMLTVLFLQVLLSSPGPSLSPKIAAGQGVIYNVFAYLSLFCTRLVDWPYNAVAIFGVLVGMAVLRFRGYVAFLSLALGAILGGIVVRWLA